MGSLQRVHDAFCGDYNVVDDAHGMVSRFGTPLCSFHADAGGLDSTDDWLESCDTDTALSHNSLFLGLGFFLASVADLCLFSSPFCIAIRQVITVTTIVYTKIAGRYIVLYHKLYRKSLAAKVGSIRS